MRRALIALLVLIVVLAGCAGKGGKKVDLTAPFVGGTAGISADFLDSRKQVFDGGRDPFDIVVKLENKGESTVLPNRVRVKLSGVNPSEFSKLEEDLTKNPPDELTAVRKDSQGNTIPGAQTTVEFNALNHFSQISGAQVTFPLRADVCYTYTTNAVSKMCVRSNIMNPEPNGICEVNEDKPVFNSGAPVQVSSVKESAFGKDKLSISFSVDNVGGGDTFERGSVCDRSTRSKAGRVYVIVDTGVPGISCTGLQTTGTHAEGFVTLYDNKKLVTCTQTVASHTDFEQQIDIAAIYDYEQFQQTDLTVKSSGEAPAPTADVVADAPAENQS